MRLYSFTSARRRVRPAQRIRARQRRRRELPVGNGHRAHSSRLPAGGGRGGEAVQRRSPSRWSAGGVLWAHSRRGKLLLQQCSRRRWQRLRAARVRRCAGFLSMGNVHLTQISCKLRVCLCVCALACACVHSCVCPPARVRALPRMSPLSSAPLRVCSRLPRTLPMPRICLPWHAWAARRVATDVLGRRRVRTGECASAARWRARARARALSDRNGCSRLCVPLHAPR